MAMIEIDVLRINSRVEFRVSSTESRPFVLNSFLIVDDCGRPIWEFVRREFETVENPRLSTTIIDVMTDAFRDSLRREETANLRRRETMVVQGRYFFEYGMIPPTHKQTIPAQGLSALEAGVTYRAVVFSSIGQRSAVFHA